MKILFTGGGTAGHVMPNLALMQKFLKEGWEVYYIGSKTGMEKGLVSAVEGVQYFGIDCGKLRRYFSLKNFTDPIRVIKGVTEARKIMKQVKPDVVFSKGGYVSLPVVRAAGKIPVISHESDYSPGLANRLAEPFCDRICVTFEDTVAMIPKGKGVFTGTPIRPELYEGSREKGFSFTGLKGDKPVLLIMGGSSGALHMNELVQKGLDRLLETFDIIHLCGKGKTDASLSRDGYLQYEYISEEMKDLFAITDIAISRAGANAVFELLALGIPSVLIPLPLSASRGDQILNAKYCLHKGYAEMIDQDTATPDELVDAVMKIYKDRDAYVQRMHADPRLDGTEEVLEEIKKAVTGK